MIITGFMLGAMLRNLTDNYIVDNELELNVIGYIIPGLIAIWIDRQGFVETLSKFVETLSKLWAHMGP